MSSGLFFRHVASRRIALAVTAALALAAGPRPAGAIGGVSQGSDPGCTAGVVVNVKVNNPTQVAGNATATCPVPGATPGNTYGPHTAYPPYSPPPKCTPTSPPGANCWKPGGPCSYHINEPDTVTPQTDPQQPYVLNRTGPGPGASGQWFMDLASSQVVVNLASNQDLYEPFLVTGTYDANGNCVGTLTQSLCIIPGSGVTYTPVPGGNQCFVFQPHPITAPGGLNPGLLTVAIVNLVGQVKGLVHPGQISSLPSQAGLVNHGTCFYLGGNLNVPQQASWDIILQGPDDGSGRHIFFVFRIQVSYQGTQWNFGDGIPTESAPPPECAGIQSPVAPTAHVYQRYSDGQPGGMYQVTATETYGVNVWEMWTDTSGTFTLNLGNAGVAPFGVPVPAHPQQIIQEEGVPIGS